MMSSDSSEEEILDIDVKIQEIGQFTKTENQEKQYVMLCLALFKALH